MAFFIFSFNLIWNRLDPISFLANLQLGNPRTKVKQSLFVLKRNKGSPYGYFENKSTEANYLVLVIVSRNEKFCRADRL